MRSKFSELIAQGVTRFNYTPIIQETPCTDPVCLEYNNIFGPAMDTHMSILEDGTRVITGHRVANEREWADFANSYRWNGVDFHDSGYCSLNEFFSRYGLTYTRGMLNGDVVICVTKLEIPQETEMPKANESLTESLNVFMVTNKKTNKSYIVVANDEKESIDLVPDDSKNDLKSSKVNIKTPKGFTKPIIIKDSDQVINESEIEQILNEARKIEYRVALNDVLDEDELPISVTISVEKEYQRVFEKWLNEEEGNIFTHADGGNVEY